MARFVFARSTLFLFSLLVSGTVCAESTQFDTQIENTVYVQEWISGCQNFCKTAAQSDGERLMPYFLETCQAAYEAEKPASNIFIPALTIADRAVSQSPICIGKGLKVAFWDFPKAVFSPVWGKILNSNASSEETKKFLEQCEQDLDCRRSLARNLNRYSDHDKSGKFKINNQRLDEEIKNLGISRLFREAQVDRQRKINYCRRVQSRVVQRTYPSHPNKTSREIYKIIYDKIDEENKQCLSLLDMAPVEHLPNIKYSSMGELIQASTSYLKRTSSRLYGNITDWTSGVFRAFKDLPTTLGTARVCLSSEDYNKFVTDICSGVVPTPGLAVGHFSRKFKNVFDNKRIGIKPLTKGKPTPHFKNHPNHKKLIDEYAGKVYVSEKRNQEFIDVATKGVHPRRRYFDAENAALKDLNTITDDKDLVTALTNYHKKTLLSEFDKLKRKYPEYNFQTYSDFKSVKLAIEANRNFTKALNDKVLADINQAFKNTNERFARKMQEAKVDIEALGPQDTWFRAGFGETVDEASLAARKARQFKGQVGVLDYNTQRVKGELENKLDAIESQRETLAATPSIRRILTPDESGVMLPREDAFELVRKNKDPKSLAQAMSNKYGQTFSEDEARLLLNYANGVDEFSPTILVAKRETPSLDSSHGGITADFLGLGAANLQGTATALARSGRDLKQSVRQARIAEQNVTHSFARRKSAFQRMAQGDVVCTGDDCVKALTRPMSYREKEVLLNRVASNPDTRRVRMSFVAPNVNKSHQMVIATHGEAIEKALRKSLTGKLSEDKLSRITFGLDMNAPKVGVGEVNLIIGRTQGLKLSRREQLLIHKHFTESVREGKYYSGTSSVLSRRLYIIPGPPPALLPPEEGSE